MDVAAAYLPAAARNAACGSGTLLTTDTFEMIETLSRAALERHPVWTHYDKPEDRDVILGWGVPRQALDEEIARYEFCGPQPLYPVLEFDPLPPKDHLIVGATFALANGTTLTGYLLEPHAFGLFVENQEFCFNRSLASLSDRTAGRLAAALGERPDELFPMRYTTGVRASDGRTIEGEIDRFW